MDESLSKAIEGVLGYLNYSSGNEDKQFQKNMSAIWDSLDDPIVGSFHKLLASNLSRLHHDSSAFEHSEQAARAIGMTFEQLIPAYRAHHCDLLGHLEDRELFQPLMLARLFETTLNQMQSHESSDDLVRAGLHQLNDFLGHRPVATLETDMKIQPYDHERVRPIPVYTSLSGTATGKYQLLLNRVIEILTSCDSDLLEIAYFDPNNLKELAIDPRAYDFSHPAHHRTNYVFGEWDPHQIDSKGRFTRFIVRDVTLDGLLDRVESAPSGLEEERLEEAASVLAGTMLMAACISGTGPESHYSTVTLEVLMGRVASLRDKFYDFLLGRMEGPFAERLRAEANKLHQPFGGARQHLNHHLAAVRARQIENTHLSVLFARMGHADAAREQVQSVPTASARMQCQLRCRLAIARGHVRHDNYQGAFEEMIEAEDILHRAIECGAMVDPWNILGFQGQYSVFPARENTVPDQRVSDLTLLMHDMFSEYGRLLISSASFGEDDLPNRIVIRMQGLADWWDQFATVGVEGIEEVHGQEELDSAQHVAGAMAAWRSAENAAGDVAFWRDYCEGFSTPRAYGLVVDALLENSDYVAAMALLMHWLSQADEVLLVDNSHSFHELCGRWLLSVLQTSEDPQEMWTHAVRFFDRLEANAEERWKPPELQWELVAGSMLDDFDIDDFDDDEMLDEEEDDKFAAAYEGVQYKDTAQDGIEGETVGDPDEFEDFILDEMAQPVADRLQFIATVAKLWQLVGRAGLDPDVPGPAHDKIIEWRANAHSNVECLKKLLDEIHDIIIPRPSGSNESMVEHDHRVQIKDRLTWAVISTVVESIQSIWWLGASLDGQETEKKQNGFIADWVGDASLILREIHCGNAQQVSKRLDTFLDTIAGLPLLYVPPGQGGAPWQIAATQCLQGFLRHLAADLPRRGLIIETWNTLQMARSMERDHPVGRGAITEFDRLYRDGYGAVVEAILDSVDEWPDGERQSSDFLKSLEDVAITFLTLWTEHSHATRLSSAESLSDDDWADIIRFICKYGQDLLTPRFLTLGNIRAILDQGIDIFLDYQEQNQDPLHPVKLIEDIDNGISRTSAKHHLDMLLRLVSENYECYRDFKMTSIHSDYGERFHILMDFLRLKAKFERVAWQLEPVRIAHELLAKRGHTEQARQWQEALEERTKDVVHGLKKELRALEARHATCLRGVSELINEGFTRRLGVDRISALIEPAVREVDRDEDRTFQLLQEEIRDFTKIPSGTGLEVPNWILDLEDTLDDMLDKHKMLNRDLKQLLRAPRTSLQYEQYAEQIEALKEK